jgi:hypothetical protein
MFGKMKGERRADMSVAETILQKTLALPEDRQREVLKFVEKLEQTAARRSPLIDPYGTLADKKADLSLEDFQQARRETWAHFPREFPNEGR